MTKKNSNNTLVIILIVITVVLVIALILYFLLQKRDNYKKKGLRGKKNKLNKSLLNIKFSDKARKCMVTGTWIVDPKDPSKNRCVKDKKIDTSKLTQNKYYTETNPIEYNWEQLPYPFVTDPSSGKPPLFIPKNGKYNKKFNTGSLVTMSPDGKKIFFYISPFIVCGSVNYKGVRTTWKQSKKEDKDGNRTPFRVGTVGYGIIGIYDIGKKRIIDTIQDIGSVGNIVPNYDGSVISFNSTKDWEKPSKIKMETHCIFREETIDKLLTYKLNPITSKYEPFLDPIIIKKENPGMTTIGGYGIIRKKEIPASPYRKFGKIGDWALSLKNKKLITNFGVYDDSFIEIYNMIDNKWQRQQVITKEIFAEVPSPMHPKYISPELKGVSEDFKTILLFNWRIGRALVFRLNEENNKYEQLGDWLGSGFGETPTTFTTERFETGTIDQTGNRLAFAVGGGKDVVFIYNYDQDQDQWIKTQEIFAPEQITRKYTHFEDGIYFGQRTLKFANQGQLLFAGTNIGKFINIYKLDPTDNQYKFFDMLTQKNDWTNFGNGVIEISENSNTIVVGSPPSWMFNIPGGISIFKKK